MKPCEYYEELLSRLQDGEIAPEEEAELWEHIAQCPDCARTYETYAQMTRALRNDLAEPPAALSRLVMARIAGQTPSVTADGGKKHGAIHRLRSWRAVAVAACFVAVVAAGAITGVFGRDSRLSDTAGAPSAGSALSGNAQELSDERSASCAAESQDAGDAAPVNEAVPDAASGDVMTIMEPRAAAAVPGQAYDSAGQSLGVITDGDALAGLFTGEPWQGALPEAAYTVTLSGVSYSCAPAEDGRLLWWRAGDDTAAVSPGTLADLLALIQAP